MKKRKNPFGIYWTLFLFMVIFINCKLDKGAVDKKNSSAASDTWELIFEEEFADLTAWEIWYGGAYNNEIQLYRPEQLSLDSGRLKIHALRKEITGPTLPTDSITKRFEYVSGRIESKQTFGPSDADGEREYRIMARIKLPLGHGMWPAFWSYGSPWPTQGEIDILEARGGEPDRFSSNLFYGPTNGVNINQDTEVKHTIGRNLTEEFHIYEMIWRADTIVILFDNEVLHTYTANSNNNISQLFGKKQQIVLNTAVGGWFIEDQNASNFADSATMEVDWVRVYKK